MAAPTWVAAGTKTQKPTNSGTTSSVAPPAGHATNDLLVIVANPFSGVTLSTPSGWTLLGDSGSWASGHRSYLYWKLATSSSEPSVTLTTSAGAYNDSQMYAFRGVDTTTPIDAATVYGTVATGGAANVSVPALTTVTNDALLVDIGLDTGSFTWDTPPAGATERVETGIYIVKFVVATETKTTAGTEAADIYAREIAAGSDARVAAFAIRPAGGAGGPVFVPRVIAYA